MILYLEIKKKLGFFDNNYSDIKLALKSIVNLINLYLNN